MGIVHSVLGHEGIPVSEACDPGAADCDVERRFSADRVKLAERSSGPQAKKSQ